MTHATAARTDGLARGLGFASLGLGASELLAPDAVASLAGVRPTGRTRTVIRALGARECAHGAAVLAGSPTLVWTRVLGDVLDVALLLKGLAGRGADKRRGAIALAGLSVIGAADVYAAKGQLS
ncbi:malate dehydrogenase [Mycolicibacterium grossiae]|uniref:Malate dehydrogenase n=1 Tax=Mycolicibacterium grossiae TaxID=1552759 RepID=A0A1E8QAL8_9MYCO|nr:malate dehydrogenase [Mycolicibacterium grossiae]OFJ55110.1 malate dehydrogenase [Mycolicibacterium grossiae]QEM47888.1 malate dehydrogenase [Mycolicibacterium grossiae]